MGADAAQRCVRGHSVFFSLVFFFFLYHFQEEVFFSFFLFLSLSLSFFFARLDFTPVIFSSLRCSHLSLPKIPFLCLLNNKPASACGMGREREEREMTREKERWKVGER